MIVHPRLAQGRFEKEIHTLLESPAIFEGAGIRLIRYQFPVLIVAIQWRAQSRWPKFRLDASDHNYRPLRGWWVGDDESPLLPGLNNLPGGLGFQTGSPPSGEQRSWLCFKGWWDWHNHSSHQDTAWALLRSKPEFGALALLQQLHFNLNRPGVTTA